MDSELNNLVFDNFLISSVTAQCLSIEEAIKLRKRINSEIYLLKKRESVLWKNFVLEKEGFVILKNEDLLS